MNIKWLVADVAAVRSPDRAEHAKYFGSDFGWTFFWSIQAVFLVWEPLCDVGTPLLSSNMSTPGHLMKIEQLVTDVTADRSPDRAEHAILGVILVVRFWTIQAVFAVRSGSHLVMQEPHLQP